MRAELDNYIAMFKADDMWLNVAVAVIAAPIFEEYIFRGIIQRDIAYRWNPRIAIILSAAIFSLLHFNIVQLIPSFIMGLYLGYVYYRTNYSLVTMVAIHSLNNLISITFIYTGLAEKDIVALVTDSEITYYAIFIVSAIIVLKLFVQILLVKPKQ